MKLVYQKKNDSYQTIRDIIKLHFGISDRLTTKLKKAHSIFLNHQPMLYLDQSIKEDDWIEIVFPELQESNIIPTKMKISILYEDDCYLILDKPAGIAIHPSLSHYTNTLSNGIAYYYSQIGLKQKIHIVTRLDKNTSGLVIVAKNEYIQENLNKQMKQQLLIKKYLAIVQGSFPSQSGMIHAPIKRKESSIIEREVNIEGKDALTYYKVIKEMKNMSLVEFSLKTGRTHQIRVHSAYLGHPIIGDSLYGTSSPLIKRQALHCFTLSFLHPLTKKRVTYSSSMPKDMETLLK